MKYYIIAREYNYPGEQGYYPVDLVQEGDDSTPEEVAKYYCEEEAKYIEREYGIKVSIIHTSTGCAFMQDGYCFRCDIIPRNTNF